MYQPLLVCHDIGQHIQIKGKLLTSINIFKYLGSTVTTHYTNSYTSKAFGKLRNESVLKKGLSMKAVSNETAL